MSFQKWLKMREGRKELATAYKDTLRGVPQDPTHHPEGDVLVHSRLVRRAIPKAIQELQIAQTTDGNPLQDVLSQVDFRLSPQEEKIVVLAAWLHDIGKRTATTYEVGKERVRWDQAADRTGRIQAIDHQSPTHYLPQLAKLKKVAPQETIDLYLQNEGLVNWLIEHHMDFASGQGFSKRFVAENFDGHRVQNSLRMRLLLVLMWADKMGRKPEDTIMASLQKNVRNLVTSSDRAAKRQAYIDAGGGTAFQGDPAQFAAMLKQRQMAPNQRVRALQGKFPHLSPMEIEKLLSEGFRSFMEAVEPTTEKANIPVPKECVLIARALTHGHPETEVYGVGGVVRDHLFGKDGKDFDLTTNLTDQEIVERSKKAGFKVMEKESNTFGVVFVHTHTGEKEPTEVAPFRTDVGSADGRRPDEVQFGVGIQDDAMRRDFTINNLYYDFGFGRYGEGLVLDFNPGGQGLQDVKDGVVRPVGDPMERFGEDRLRILRLMRFFARFNEGDISQFLDDRTKEAIQSLGNLRSPANFGGTELEPISGERIQGEFLKGLEQSQNTVRYLQNYVDTGLMQQVFPGLRVDVSMLHTLQNTKNPKVVLAWLLRGNKNVGDKLVDLNWPLVITKHVQFLSDALNFGAENAFDLIKRRDQQLLGKKAIGPGGVPLTPQQIEKKNRNIAVYMSRDLSELARLTGNQDIIDTLTHLGGTFEGEEVTTKKPDGSEETNWEGDWVHQPYQPPKIDARELMQQGLKGPELGAEIQRRTLDDYRNHSGRYRRLPRPTPNFNDPTLD